VTAGECDLWRQAYAASWHVSGWRASPGPVSDFERARWAARQADRALEALRAIASGSDVAKSSERAAEVLR